MAIPLERTIRRKLSLVHVDHHAAAYFSLEDFWGESVVLSKAKDVIVACRRHEILRFAQDDRGRLSIVALLLRAIFVGRGF
jgi:hypothetical protein